MAKKQTLLSRFEQRKKAVKSQALKQQQNQQLQGQERQKADIDKLTDAQMPAIDKLNEDSDYAQFFSKKVSETLRRKALRKLFLSPSINVLDGLNDYDEDYRVFEILGDIIPYDLKQELKREAQELQESAAQKSENQLQNQDETAPQQEKNKKQ